MGAEIFFAVSAVFVGMSVIMLMMRGRKVTHHATALIEAKARMRVHTLAWGEFLGERRRLMIGSEFYLIRRAGNCVICRTFDKGEMFFMRYHDYVEALQEARIREFYA